MTSEPLHRLPDGSWMLLSAIRDIGFLSSYTPGQAFRTGEIPALDRVSINRGEAVLRFDSPGLAAIGDARWDAMVSMGLAERGAGTPIGNWFRCTRRGAELVLDRGEALDPEDFPETAHA